MVVEVKRNYTFINTKELMKFKSKHSIRLLPLLYKVANYSDNVGKRKRMTLEELNEFFGTKYRNYYDLEHKILIPVKEELDTNSKISFVYEFEYESLGRGRPRVNEVVIDVISKDQNKSKHQTLFNQNELRTEYDKHIGKQFKDENGDICTIKQIKSILKDLDYAEVIVFNDFLQAHQELKIPKKILEKLK